MNTMLIFLLTTVMLSTSSALQANVIKCCPEGYFFVVRNGTCLDPYNHTTSPTQFTCKQTLGIIKPTRSLNIDDVGALKLTTSEGINVTSAPGQFCIGNSTKIKDSIDLTKVREIPVLCLDPEVTILDPRVLSYCLIISAIFLAITTAVYAVLPELRRDVQGMSFVNFCGSLAVALAMLSILRMVAVSDTALCAVRGFLCYFFVMVSFFWTNAIAIQVLRSVSRPTIGNKGWMEFRWYALYAWGCGALLTICVAVANYHPGDHEKPGIGLKYCWIHGTRLLWLYVYSVMIILLSVNLCIFVYTSTLIWRHSFSSSNIKALKYKFVMSIRLIILMGLPWIFEMIMSSVDEHIVWAIVNIIIALQGLLIFLVLVVFRKRAVRAMHTHGWLRCVAPLVERYLARGDDEELAVNHTEVPMNDHNGI